MTEKQRNRNSKRKGLTLVLLYFFLPLFAQEFRSEKASIDLGRGKKPIGFATAGDMAPNLEAMVNESVYYGLVIGVDNYMDPAIQSLDHAVADAQKVFDMLSTKYTFEKGNIRFLKDPKRDDIIYALDYLSNVVTPNDNLVIFYAGHGHWDANASIGFWLPSDARKISSTDWFRNSTLVDYLKAINSRHTLLITDACFGGSIFKTRTAFDDAPQDIKVLYEYPSRTAMTSGAMTEVPDESSFTKYLLERLEKNREKYLSAEQLFSSMRTAVINNSEAIPQYGEIRNVGDQGGDFVFIKK
ncbi:MAG: caspase family protein [Bacteroidota bacterium]